MNSGAPTPCGTLVGQGVVGKEGRMCGCTVKSPVVHCQVLQPIRALAGGSGKVQRSEVDRQNCYVNLFESVVMLCFNCLKVL